MELDDLIRSIDIVEYISQYIELNQRGDEWWGLSCFKTENTPSFSVRQDPPVFFDYSSGIGGNVFTFIKKYNDCSPKEAIEIMKNYIGCSDDVNLSSQKLSATMVCRKYQKPKTTQKECTATVLPDSFMERYEKTQEKLDVWRAEGISDDSLDKFQVFYDSYSDRLVYPIRNPDGKIVNIGGRTLDPDWKIRNQRKYCYFYPWGSLNTIYGLAENLEDIKKSNEIILFEGCKSVLLADTWGVHNAGAILTSHLNPNQLKLLARLGCRVVFALDKDVDITKDHNINKLKQFLNIEFINDTENLLNDKDSPVDKGFEVFQRLYDNRKRLR